MCVFRSPFSCPALPHGILLSSPGRADSCSSHLQLSGSLEFLLSPVCLPLPVLSPIPIPIPVPLKPAAPGEGQSQLWVLQAVLREARRVQCSMKALLGDSAIENKAFLLGKGFTEFILLLSGTHVQQNGFDQGHCTKRNKRSLFPQREKKLNPLYRSRLGQDIKGAVPFGDSSPSSCACYSQKQKRKMNLSGKSELLGSVFSQSTGTRRFNAVIKCCSYPLVFPKCPGHFCYKML